ncbi:hypothetical protein DP939_40290 [Spongiactinospora rosea]|uniref:non-specific serine/threonine protein kinase n=1 Tax=Spongiactinospora rosea TaxID=2248750 RepID=A0A366LL08_9ACTN|nr:serine/threonine-protein kinase [Spongiactinospora rosea]RBQ14507.1 hypothetical protein DP939_40290 [Spongiactinospora rosea]
MSSGDQHDALGSGYQLLDKIGEGAMGAVWRAVDRRTGEHVAAKLLHGRLLDDPDIVGRFVQERSVLLRLRHHGIVAIRDFVIEGSRVAIVMDLVEGADLGRYLRERGTLPPAEAVGIVIELAGALAAAHAAGVVHRDVKPANVLLGRSVMLTDFGVARILQGPAAAATAVVGTPIYMAPEAIEGASAAPAADVYALGMVLYELLAGRAPFAGGNHLSALHSAFNMTPRRLPGMGDEIWSIIQDATAKDPARRPTVPVLAERLRAVLPAVQGTGALPRVHRDAPLALTTVPVERAAQAAPTRRRRKRVIAAVSSVVAAGALTLVAVQFANAGSGPADPHPTPVAAGRTVAPTPEVSLAPPQVVELSPTATPEKTDKSGKSDKKQDPSSARRPATSDSHVTAPPTKRADKPSKGETSPKPTKTASPSPAKPSFIQEGPVRRDEMRCREPWLVVAKAGIAMRPCIRVKDGIMAVMGQVRGSKGVTADAHVELWRPGVGTMLGPYICNGMRFTYDGQIKTCGWFKVDPPDGATYQARQRWRLSGKGGDFNGGAQSAGLEW